MLTPIFEFAYFKDLVATTAGFFIVIVGPPVYYYIVTLEESNPDIPENAEVGLVLGGFVIEFTKNVKFVFADNGLELKVNYALYVLPDFVQVTADVRVYEVQLAVPRTISDGKVNCM